MTQYSLTCEVDPSLSTPENIWMGGVIAPGIQCSFRLLAPLPLVASLQLCCFACTVQL